MGENGLVRLWEMEEGSGSSSAEAFGSSNAASWTGGVSWSTGFDGGGALEGDGQGVIAMGEGSDGSLDFGEESFSVALWVRTPETALLGVTTLIAKGNETSEAGYRLDLPADGKFEAGLGSDGSGNGAAIRTQSTFLDGKWHHVAVVWDRVEGSGRIYVDGVAQALAVVGGSDAEVDGQDATKANLDGQEIFSANSSASLLAGGRETTQQFEGRLDDLRMYRGALSEQVIEGLLNVDADEDGLPDYWEWEYFGTLNRDGTGDFDGDGQSDLSEYQGGSDPNDYYSQTGVQITPVLVKVSGDGQSGLPEEFIANALVVKVVDNENEPLANAPVEFEVISGGGQLAAVAQLPAEGTTFAARTDNEGKAAVYYLQGEDYEVTSTIQASTGGGADPVSFTLFTQEDMIGYWKLDEAVGLVASDSSYHENEGALAGGAQWTEGFDGNFALGFEYPGSHASMGTPAVLDMGANSFSVAFWMKIGELPESPAISRILSKGHVEGSPGYFVGIDSEGKLITGIGSTEAQGDEVLYFGTAAPLEVGQWHHVTVVFDRAGGIGGIHVNGEAMALEKMAGSGGVIDVQEPEQIDFSGLEHLDASAPSVAFTLSGHNGEDDFFIGEVDEVKIYPRVLSQNEIEDLHLVDSDNGGLPDWWEWKHFGQLGIDAQADADGDGLSNGAEYEAGSDPNDYYSQGETTLTPVIAIVGGNNQISGLNEYLGEPLSVEVRDSVTEDVLVNAPVVYSVADGGGLLAATHGSADPVTPLEVRTDNGGIARAHYRQGMEAGVESHIVAQSGTAAPVEFEALSLGKSGLVGHWKFDEAGGTTAEDSGPFGYDGTLINGPAWTERYAGEGSLSFSGAVAESGNDDHVEVASPASGLLDFEEGDFTIAFWFKVAEGVSAGRIASKGAEAWKPGYYVGIDGSGRIEAAIGSTPEEASESLLIHTLSGFDDEEWHHAGIVIDRADGQARIYIDGQAQELGQASGSGGAPNVEDASVFEFGQLESLDGEDGLSLLSIASNGAIGGFFKGSLDDVRIYRKALSGQEIAGELEQGGRLEALEATLSLNEDSLGILALEHTGGGDGPAVYQIVSEPQEGRAEVDGSTLKYYPNVHYNGSDSLRFKVSKGGRMAEADVLITVNPVNDPPLVYAGANQSVVLPGTAQLEGTITDIDTDVEEIQTRWVKISGPAEVTFAEATALETTASFASAGTYVLRLIAVDGNHLRSDSLMVVVEDDDEDLPAISLQVPVTETVFGRDDTVSLKAAVVPAGSASISKVAFYEGSRKIGESTSADPVSGLYEMEWNPPRIGIYGLSAVALDSEDRSNVSNTAVVRVSDGAWFDADNGGVGNEGFSGSGGDGGAESGGDSGPGGDFGEGTGENGGGDSAGGEGHGGGGSGGDGGGGGAPGGGGGNGGGGLPWNDDPNFDSDGDGLADIEDAVASNPNMMVPAAPEANYVVIDLGLKETVGSPQGINDRGEVLLVKQVPAAGTLYQGILWKEGGTTALAASERYWGPLQDGTVYFKGQKTIDTSEYHDPESSVSSLK